MFRFFDFFPLTVRRSPFAVVCGALILNLALFSPCRAIQAVQVSGAAQKNKSAKTVQTLSPQAAAQSQAANRNILNIVVDRIEGGAIYSKDGREFQITGSTKIIDNRKNATGAKIAELAFDNGGLVSVILK
jgi:hypothetical protein